MHSSADEVTATVRVQYEEPVQAHCGCGYSSVAPRHTSASRRHSQVRSAVALVLLSLLAVLLLAYGGNVDFSHRRGIVSTEAGWLEESWVHGNPGSPAGPWEAKPSPRYPSSSDWPSRVVIDLAKTCGADNRLPCETWQSSTAKDAVASRALETDDKCTLTQLQNNPWWMVDLGRQATVKGLALRGHEFVEVDNLARSCGENKDDACIATQSSTEQSGEASRAVDGDIIGQFEAGSVTHTAGDANPWWRLDFGRQVQVSALKVYGRRDCCADRLQGFDVYVGDNATQPNANEACATNQDQPPTPSIDTETNMYSDVSCDTALKGRYLWIQKPGAAGSILSLAEVQVSGYVLEELTGFQVRVASIAGANSEKAQFMSECLNKSSARAASPFWQYASGPRGQEASAPLTVPLHASADMSCTSAIHGKYVYIEALGPGRMLSLCRVEVWGTDYDAWAEAGSNEDKWLYGAEPDWHHNGCVPGSPWCTRVGENVFFHDDDILVHR